jgi:hypothetical protein
MRCRHHDTLLSVAQRQDADIVLPLIRDLERNV